MVHYNIVMKNIYNFYGENNDTDHLVVGENNGKIFYRTGIVKNQGSGFEIHTMLLLNYFVLFMHYAYKED